MPKGVYKRTKEMKTGRNSHPAWNKGKKCPQFTGNKHPMYGKTHSKEAKRKISEAGKGRIVSEITKKRLSEAGKGHFGYWFGKKRPEETKRKMALSHKGEKCNFWKGGISDNPYSEEWTNTLKTAIRQRDNFICQICSEKRSVVVHHIDYDKLNSNPNNLITLCVSCHAKTNRNRDKWIKYFKAIITNRTPNC